MLVLVSCCSSKKTPCMCDMNLPNITVKGFYEELAVSAAAFSAAVNTV